MVSVSDTQTVDGQDEFDGLKVTLDEPISLGLVLQLGIDLAYPKQRIHIVGEVMWCRPQSEEEGGGYALGFELIESDGTDIEDWKKFLATLDGLNL